MKVAKVGVMHSGLEYIPVWLCIPQPQPVGMRATRLWAHLRGGRVAVAAVPFMHMHAGLISSEGHE